MENNKVKVARTATQALLILWEERFFHVWKKYDSIEERLAKRGNHFSAAELGMALKRARYLTRKGKRRSYEYIQKYPFVQEAAALREKKKA